MPDTTAAGPAALATLRGSAGAWDGRIECFPVLFDVCPVNGRRVSPFPAGPRRSLWEGLIRSRLFHRCGELGTERFSDGEEYLRRQSLVGMHGRRFART